MSPNLAALWDELIDRVQRVMVLQSGLGGRGRPPPRPPPRPVMHPQPPPVQLGPLRPILVVEGTDTQPELSSLGVYGRRSWRQPMPTLSMGYVAPDATVGTTGMIPVVSETQTPDSWYLMTSLIGNTHNGGFGEDNINEITGLCNANEQTRRVNEWALARYRFSIPRFVGVQSVNQWLPFFHPSMPEIIFTLGVAVMARRRIHRYYSGAERVVDPIQRHLLLCSQRIHACDNTALAPGYDNMVMRQTIGRLVGQYLYIFKKNPQRGPQVPDAGAAIQEIFNINMHSQYIPLDAICNCFQILSAVQDDLYQVYGINRMPGNEFAEEIFLLGCTAAARGILSYLKVVPDTPTADFYAPLEHHFHFYNLRTAEAQIRENPVEFRIMCQGFYYMLTGIIHAHDTDCRFKFFRSGTLQADSGSYTSGMYEQYFPTIRWEVLRMMLVFFIQYNAAIVEARPNPMPYLTSKFTPAISAKKNVFLT